LVLLARLAAALTAWIALFPAPLQAQLDWQPEKTWLFAVGVLQWQHGDVWPGMPGAKTNRRDAELVEHFRSRGVPGKQIVYLQDREATRKRIQHALTEHLARTRSGDLLIFYYTGHGSRNHETHKACFANYDAASSESAWQVSEIFDAIEQGFRGDRALLIADCCFSGALVDVARQRESKIAYGCLCSSFSHNTSTGNWTFTESLLKGWRGDPGVDLDGDGAIEWQEMGRSAELDMAFIERQKSMFQATHGFDPRMKLVAANGPRRPRLGERLEAKWKGAWYRAQVIDVRGEQLKIHYAGDADSWDEWVGPERIRPFRPRQFDIGQQVDVKWDADKKWYPAAVIRPWYGLHLVGYDGYPPEWNEWVGPDSIRPRH
jgi:hypothetical protein